MGNIKTELTTEVFDELVKKGYIYFLSKPGVANGDIFDIELLPINYNPEQIELPNGFDSWYNINEDGYEMAQGVEAIRFIVLETNGK